MTEAREIELKFLLAPEAAEAVLAAAPEGKDEVKDLAATYFDTPDFKLQKAGASLRVRESKGRHVQTLKLGHGLSREEHEAPVKGAKPDTALPPLPKLLPDGEASRLAPAFQVKVQRRQRLIRYAGAEIELALDHGEVRAGDASSPVSELELELMSGEPAALFALARDLVAKAPLYLSFDTKSDRGQALVAGESLTARRKARLAVGKDPTVAEVFQAIAQQSLALIAGHAVTLREGPDPEAVHQMRVAARTLRSAFSTFREVVADRDSERLKGELRWLAKACDTARNLDVFAEETLAASQDLEPKPHGLEALKAAIDAAREVARREVCEAVSSPRFRSLLIDIAAWSEAGDWLADRSRTGEPATAFAARALDRRFRKLLKRGRRLRRIDDEARHEVRIEGKKLRYAAEAFAPIYGDKKASRFISKVKGLQEHLGALNDLATAEPLIESLGLEPDAAFAAGELVGLKAAHKDEQIEAAAEAMGRLSEAEPFWR
jgi:inorganic triphosphatase YgiF